MRSIVPRLLEARAPARRAHSVSCSPVVPPTALGSPIATSICHPLSSGIRVTSTLLITTLRNVKEKEPMTEIPAEAKHLLGGRQFAHIATLMPDGSPQVS